MKKIISLVIISIVMLANLTIISAVGKEEVVIQDDITFDPISFGVRCKRGSISVSINNHLNESVNYTFGLINIRNILRISLIQRIIKRYDPISSREGIYINGTVLSNSSFNKTIPINYIQFSPVIIVLEVSAGNESIGSLSGKYLVSFGYVFHRLVRCTMLETGSFL